MIEDTGTTYIEKSIEQYSVDKIEYALLPAWFMTFWYRHELYTILVNGQTGKVVGNIPVNKRSFISDAVMTGVVCCTIGAVVFYEINQGIAKGYGFFHEYGGSIIVFLFMLAAGLFTRNLSKYNRYKHDKERLASSTTTDYVKERQGIVCGGLFAAGLLLSWMLRSNLHGEMETEKEFARQHKISYYQIDQGHKILFF